MGSPASAPNTNEVYEFGGFTLDVEERRFVHDGQSVPLPPRVFDTLLILLRNAGSLVRKSDLMDFVWPGARVEEVNLAHNISDLRRILGAAAIQTVPKHGYRFVEPVAKKSRTSAVPAPEISEPEPAPPPVQGSRRMSLQTATAALLLLALIAFAFSRPAVQASRSAAPHIQAVRARLTGNPQALQFYLKGRYFFDRRTSQDFETAAQMFQKAINIDPKYAEAYAGLAKALVFSSKPGFRAALDRALALDPNLAEAHALVGLNAMNGDWDWAKADREFRRAIQLDPNLAEAHQWYGDFLGYMGRFDQSAAELNAAIALDPLSPILWSDKCEMLTLASRFSEAISACRYVLEMQPDYFIAHYQLVEAYILNRQAREAKETAQAAVREDPRAIAVARLAQAYAAAGDRVQSHALLERLASNGDDRRVPFEIAMCYAVLGERDRTLDWLEQAQATGAALMIGLKMNPLFAGLRTEPRFRAVLDKMHMGN